MSQRKVHFSENSFFHIYNRGNSKQDIFLDQEDYFHFMNLLFISNNDKRFVTKRISDEIYNYKRGDPLVAIGVYCLMPNHFHILITQTNDGGISIFMKKLLTAYVMYFNKKYNRTGSLFEGKFKARYADNDVYLKYLYSYIHLNPIKLIQPTWKKLGIKDIQKAKSFLQNYQYSSYLDYINTKSNRYQKKTLNPENFPKYFTNTSNFKKEIFSWLNLDKG